jgi:hypothetical protein
MDISAMHTEFKLLMDKADGGISPSFLSSEIDRFLNAAIERFVAKRAFGNNPRRTGFEEDQKRRDDLRNLIINAVITPEAPSAANKPEGTFFKLSELTAGYRHAINEEAIIKDSSDDTEARRVSVKPITYDRYNKIVDDPFNKPGKDTVYRLDYGGDKVELITGAGQTITKYYLRYLKNPAVVSGSASTSCDLAGHTHREIVRMAVVEALENIEDPRYQSSKIELNDIE